MGWWNRLAREPKVKCLICEKNVKKLECAMVRYRHEQNRVGTAFVCKKCTQAHLETNESDIGEL